MDHETKKLSTLEESSSTNDNSSYKTQDVYLTGKEYQDLLHERDYFKDRYKICIHVAKWLLGLLGVGIMAYFVWKVGW